MQIERIEAIPLDVPLDRVFGGSQYAVASRCTVVTRMYTDDGLVSEVYNGDNRRHGPEIARIIQEELAPLVIGEQIFGVERIWERMFPISHPVRDRKVAMEAIACVDTALWDLIGKALGVSVSKLLGGYRTEMPIISIGGYYEDRKTLKDIAEEMAFYRERDMAGCKFKVGGLSPEEDAERVAAAREGGGPDFLLAVDANRGWSVADAVRFAQLVEQYDIAWFEEPCLWYDDVAMMAEVRRVIPIPVTAGQSEITSHAIRRMIEARAIDIMNFDASEAGGITEWRRAAALCQLSGLQVGHHEEPQIAVHLLSGIPNGVAVECFAHPARDPIWDRMLLSKPRINRGIIAVPDSPGFGIELDWGQVERYRIDQ